MIKVIRTKLKMSQSELAERLDRSQGAISHYEKGRRPIDSEFAKDLIKFCKLNGLDIDYNYIYGFTPDMGVAKKAVNG